MFRNYIGNVGIAISQLGNALTGGDPDETISSRVGKRHRDSQMTPLAWLVVWVTGRKHVAGAIEDGEGTKATYKDPSQRKDGQE